MSRLPLSTFAPIKTIDAVTRLVGYLSVLKPRERYDSRECIAVISTEELKLQFCREAVEMKIYSASDYAIYSVISKANMLKEAQELAKLKSEKKRRKEERKKKKRECQVLESERKLKEKQTIKEKEKKHQHSLLSPAYKSTTSHIAENLIIAKDVKASSFSVIKGCIYYLSYKLESVRIPAIPPEILSNIEQTFTIKKDYSSYGKNKSDRRFIFEPATDLSTFLIEATQASLRLGNSSVYIDKEVKEVVEHGIFSLPWRYVIFCDGYMFLTHPKAKGRETIDPFRYDNPSIHKSYANFMPYIEKHAVKLLVEGHDGRITRLLNFAEFAKIFPHLTSYTQMDDKDISIDQIHPVINSAYSIDEFRNARFINKSRFLAYLCKVQRPGYKIYYLLENVVHESSDSSHDEFGYLFVIRESIKTLTLIYENVTDESRSSLVFHISHSDFDTAVKFIAQFLASDEENKRLKLARGQVRFNRHVRSYDRITHTAYEEWRRLINYLIRYGSY